MTDPTNPPTVAPEHHAEVRRLFALVLEKNTNDAVDVLASYPDDFVEDVVELLSLATLLI